MVSPGQIDSARRGESRAVAAGSKLAERVAKVLEAASEAVLAAVGPRLPANAEEFAEMERRLQEVGRTAVAGPVVEAVLRTLHEDEKFVKDSVKLAASARPLTVNRYEDVTVAVVSGGVATVKSPYALPPRRRRKPGRPRGVGKRGPGGVGCYPVLARLGFVERLSPWFTSTVARAATELASFAEARDSLAARGLSVDFKAVRRIAQRMGDAGLEARRTWADLPEQRTLEGKRVVVAFDGGRVRTRVSGKRGRRREATGRRGYHTPWREPAMVAVYTVDESGRKTSDKPWYESTLGGWDAAFVIARDLLRWLGARHAAEVVIAADGAASVWDRVDDLVAALGIRPSRVTRFVDFWHAVEHLHDASNLIRSWKSDHQRVCWVRRLRRALFEGRVADVVAAIRQHAVGRNAKKVAREAAYFEKRTDLMRYDALRERGLPIGTGAVESAIRRVVNLRLKGPGIFWEEENAERMLMLRCRLKSGRWDELERDLYEHAFSVQAGALARQRRTQRDADGVT